PRRLIRVLAPDLANRLRPTSVEPVKETSAALGSVTTASPISRLPPTTTFSTPSGRPASSKMRACIKPPVIGVSLDGLSTTSLPTARAGASERMVRLIGEFHGLMIAITPSGLRKTTLSSPEISVGRIWPITRAEYEDDASRIDQAKYQTISANLRTPPTS